MIDESFFSNLYTELRPKLLGWFAAKQVDAAQAEDIIQDAFLKVWQRRDSIRPNTPEVAALIWKVVQNMRIDMYRKNQHCELTDDIETISDNEHSCSQRILDSDAQLLSTTVISTLDSMPPELAEAWKLFHSDGLTIREIATRTGASETLVKVRIHRARLKLQSALYSKTDYNF